MLCYVMLEQDDSPQTNFSLEFWMFDLRLGFLGGGF